MTDEATGLRPLWEVVSLSPTYTKLVRERRKLSMWFTIVTVAEYTFFFALVAWAPHALAHPLSGAGSVGLLAVFLQFLLGFVLVGLFLRMTERIVVPLQDRQQAEIDELVAGGAQ